MRKKLGITLLELSLINEDQLKEALLLQQSSNKRLGKILADLGYVNEKQLVLTLSLQLSIPVADFSKYEPPVGLADILPREKAERKMTLPLQKDEHNLLVAMADPLDWHTIEDLFFHTGLEIKVAVSTEEEILNAIDKFYGHLSETHNLLKEIPTYEGVELIKEQDVSSETHGINLQALYKESEAPPIVRLVTMIIADAANSQASDIHIEPREDLVEVRYRIDGVLHSVHNLPKNIQNSVISRVKIISNLDITNRRYPQDGRSALKLQDKTIDLRISTLPSIFGETVVIRLLDPKLGLVALDALGISSHVLEPLSAIFTQPQGMILITGPTGSGKTTTLYSILQQLKSVQKNAITIEDPVEYKLKGITQVGVNDQIGFTFAGALRSVLRQDPDIVMVGEIRDIDTGEIAARASLTGHLVLSTLHTNDTVSAITRLIDIGIEPYLVSSAVSGILAQRLVRKICKYCKIEIDTPPEAAKLNMKPLKKYYAGAGCDKCGQSGYSGRLGVYEFVKIDSDIRRTISGAFNEDDLWACAAAAGTRTLFEDAWIKVEQGQTTVEEVISRVHYKVLR